MKRLLLGFGFMITMLLLINAPTLETANSQEAMLQGGADNTYVPLKDGIKNTLYDGDLVDSNDSGVINLQSGWTPSTIPSTAVAVVVRVKWQGSTTTDRVRIHANSTANPAISLLDSVDGTGSISQMGVVPTTNGDIYMAIVGTGNLWLEIYGYYVPSGNPAYHFIPVKDGSRHGSYDGDTKTSSNTGAIDLQVAQAPGQVGWSSAVPSNAVAVLAKVGWQGSTNGQWMSVRAQSQSLPTVVLTHDSDVGLVVETAIIPTNNGDIFLEIPSGSTGQVWIEIHGYFVEWNAVSLDTKQGVSCSSPLCNEDAPFLNTEWVFSWSQTPPTPPGMESVPMMPAPRQQVPPTQAANVDYQGNPAWINPQNIKDNEDADKYAEVTLTVNQQSDYLEGSAFNGFYILGEDPFITGIEVQIEKHKSGSGQIQDQLVQLVTHNGQTSSNKAVAAPWGTTDEKKMYGTANDLWGLQNVTVSDFNSNFKVRLRVRATTGTATAYVDRIVVRVFWIIPEEELQGYSEYVLGYNEPNTCSQTCLTPDQAARLWNAIQERSDYSSRQLVSPAPHQLGGPVGINWLIEFRETYQTLYGEPPRLDVLAAHCYEWNEPYAPGNCQALFSQYLDLAEQWNVPGGVWVTEYGSGPQSEWYEAWTLQETNSVIAHAYQLTAWLNAEPGFARYAWFKTRSSPACAEPNPGYNCPFAPLLTLDENTLTLTPIGEMYKPFGPNPNDAADTFIPVAAGSTGAGYYPRSYGVPYQETIHVYSFYPVPYWATAVEARISWKPTNNTNGAWLRVFSTQEIIQAVSVLRLVYDADVNGASESATIPLHNGTFNLEVSAGGQVWIEIYGYYE